MAAPASVDVRALPLFVLASLAITLPIYNVLKSNPAFIAAHQFDRLDMTLLVFVLALLLPGLAVLIWLLVQRLSARAGRGVFNAQIVLWVALLVLNEISAWSMHPVTVVLVSLFLGLVVVILYWRWSMLSVFLKWYAWVLPVMMVLFVSNDSVHPFFKPTDAPVTAVRIDQDAAPPIIMVIFDELPLISLVTDEPVEGGTDEVGFAINLKRFPNLAALAETANWYPWHSTNADSTSVAIPALLSGQLPEGKATIPTWQDVPVNLYTLLAEDYRMNVFENGTHLCPTTLCESRSVLSTRKGRWTLMLDDIWISLQHLWVPAKWRSALISIDNRWLGFRDPTGVAEVTSGAFEKANYNFSDRGVVFRRFIEQARMLWQADDPKPSLSVIHSMLPHAPYKRLPDGMFYSLKEPNRVFGTLSDKTQMSVIHQMYNDNQAMLLARQQHLLQTGFADALLGELIAELRAEGIFDRSLIVVTADHGAAFKPGLSRRQIQDGNQAEIASTLLLIKRPGQQRGEVSQLSSQSVDILPSILELSGYQSPREMSGQSLLGDFKQRAEVNIQASGSQPTHFPFSGFKATVRQTLAEYSARDGNDSFDALYGLNRLEAPVEWAGQSIDVISSEEGVSESRLRIAQLDSLRRWAPANEFRLSMIYGEWDDASSAEAPEGVVVAINDRVACLSRWFDIQGFESQFRCVFDYQLMQAGDNDIQVYPLVRQAQSWSRGPAMTLEHVDDVHGVQAHPFVVMWQPRLQPQTVSEDQRSTDSGLVDHFMEGWSTGKSSIRWTVQATATLIHASRNPLPVGKYQLVLRAKALTHPTMLAEQRIRVRIDDQAWVEMIWSETEFTEYPVAFTISEPQDQLMIQFELPDAASPKEMDIGNDVRPLGVALYSWRIDPAGDEGG